MERTASVRSAATSSSKRKRSVKMIRYSGRMLAQFILVSAGVFLALALLGVSVQVYRYFKGNSQVVYSKVAAPKENTASQGESLSSLALATTVTAIQLWGKVIMSVLIPTTEHSLVYAKEGWSALQPSIKQSIVWFIYETSVTFKLSIVLCLVACFLVWLLEREIKRRRIFERLNKRRLAFVARVDAVKESISHQYRRLRDEVERESRIAAMLMPHVLYLCSVIALYILFSDFVHDFARGFGAWFIVIGFPMLLSGHQLIKYDEAYRGRLKKLNPDDENLSSSSDDESDAHEEPTSSLPPPPEPPGKLVSQTAEATAKAQAYVESIVHLVRRRLLSDASITSAGGHVPLSSDSVVDYEPISQWLRYWSVFAACLFVEQFPISGQFLSLIPIWPELRLAFAVWLQFPLTRGCDWAFSAVVPILDKYVKRIPALQGEGRLPQSMDQQRSTIVTLLTSFGLVSKTTGKRLLKATETNGTLLLVSIPFMLSPSFVTKIGVLVVGLAFPAHGSTGAVLDLEHFKSTIKKDDDANQEEDDHHLDAGELCVFWLEYWVVYVLFSLVHAPLATIFGWWFPLWDQFHLALLLWLQMSYFSGAHNIFKIAVLMGRVWRKRSRAVARRRRRTSSVAGPEEKIEGIVKAIPLLSPLLGRVVASHAQIPVEELHNSEDDDNRVVSPALEDGDPNTDTDEETIKGQVSAEQQEENISPKGNIDESDKDYGSGSSARRPSSLRHPTLSTDRPDSKVFDVVEEGHSLSDDFVAVEVDNDTPAE